MARLDPGSGIYAPRYWPYWLAFGLFRLFAFLPWSWMMAVGRGLGRLVQPLVESRVRVTDTNFRLCFPEWDARRRAEVVRRHFESLGMGLMDFAAAWWVPDRRLYPLVNVYGEEHLAPAFAGGKGVIFLTAHFTSVEISGRILTRYGSYLPMYRRNENPVIQKVMTYNRELRVERTIPREDVRLMLRSLKQNKGVWFAPDQNFGHKNSLFSPFFGIPAATNTATSRFAEMSGAKVMPFVCLRRTDKPGYDLYFEPALDGFPSGDVQRDTDRLNAIFERWIRMAPEQYLWSHRRFKDRPPGEPPLY